MANLAYDSHESRDRLLEQRTLTVIFEVFEKHKNTLSDDTRNRLAWAFCALNDLRPFPEYTLVKKTAKYLGFALNQETNPNTIHYLLKALMLSLRTERPEVIRDMKKEGVLTQVQKNFLAVKEDNFQLLDEYVLCFSYFISESQRQNDLIEILTEPKTFEKLAGLLERWKENKRIIGLLGQVIEETDNGAEDLLKYNDNTLNILSKVFQGGEDVRIFQDAVRMLGNLLFYSEKQTRKSILERIAGNSDLLVVLQALPNLKASIVAGFLEGVVEATKGLKSEKSVTGAFQTIKEVLLDTNSDVYKKLEHNEDKKLTEIFNKLKKAFGHEEEKTKGGKAESDKEKNAPKPKGRKESNASEEADKEQEEKKTNKKKVNVAKNKGEEAKGEETKKTEEKGGKKGKPAAKGKDKKKESEMDEEKEEEEEEEEDKDTPSLKKKLAGTRAIKRTKTIIEAIKRTKQLTGSEEGTRSRTRGGESKDQKGKASPKGKGRKEEKSTDSRKEEDKLKKKVKKK